MLVCSFDCRKCNYDAVCLLCATVSLGHNAPLCPVFALPCWSVRSIATIQSVVCLCGVVRCICLLLVSFAITEFAFSFLCFIVFEFGLWSNESSLSFAVPHNEVLLQFAMFNLFELSCLSQERPVVLCCVSLLSSLFEFAFSLSCLIVCDFTRLSQRPHCHTAFLFPACYLIVFAFSICPETSTCSCVFGLLLLCSSP